MFLKKHTAKTTESIQNKKTGLQDDIKERSKYLKQLQKIDTEKKQHMKGLIGLDNSAGLEGKAITQSESYKDWKKEVNAEYKEKIDILKETLSEQYLEQKQQTLNDYPIFMAIAEDIGYDATGKPTNHNELEIIGKELTRFIEQIEREKV